jgi:hypothetical protein
MAKQQVAATLVGSNLQYRRLINNGGRPRAESGSGIVNHKLTPTLRPSIAAQHIQTEKKPFNMF